MDSAVLPHSYWPSELPFTAHLAHELYSTLFVSLTPQSAFESLRNKGKDGNVFHWVIRYAKISSRLCAESPKILYTKERVYAYLFLDVVDKNMKDIYLSNLGDKYLRKGYLFSSVAV